MYNISQLLGRFKHKFATDKNLFFNLELPSTKKELNEYKITDYLNLFDRFEYERSLSDDFRIYGRIDNIDFNRNKVIPNTIWSNFTDLFNNVTNNIKNIYNSFDFYLAYPIEYVNLTDDLYYEKLKIINNPNDIQIAKAGFSNNIFNEKNYNFFFNDKINISGLTTQIKFNPNELLTIGQKENVSLTNEGTFFEINLQRFIKNNEGFYFTIDGLNGINNDNKIRIIFDEDNEFVLNNNTGFFDFFINLQTSVNKIKVIKNNGNETVNIENIEIRTDNVVLDIPVTKLYFIYKQNLDTITGNNLYEKRFENNTYQPIDEFHEETEFGFLEDDIDNNNEFGLTSSLRAGILTLFNVDELNYYKREFLNIYIPKILYFLRLNNIRLTLFNLVRNKNIIKYYLDLPNRDGISVNNILNNNFNNGDILYGNLIRFNKQNFSFELVEEQSYFFKNSFTDDYGFLPKLRTEANNFSKNAPYIGNIKEINRSLTTDNNNNQIYEGIVTFEYTGTSNKFDIDDGSIINEENEIENYITNYFNATTTELITESGDVDLNNEDFVNIFYVPVGVKQSRIPFSREQTFFGITYDFYTEYKNSLINPVQNEVKVIFRPIDRFKTFDIWYKYNPFIEINLKAFSSSVEHGNPDDVIGIPDYAYRLNNDNNYRWRDLLTIGFVEPDTGNGFDFSFINNTHYVYNNITLDVKPDLSYKTTRRLLDDFDITKIVNGYNNNDDFSKC